ncbi:hypothetical protein D9758_007885 [Tetrapyrgos nigripes]|uniref:polynucleotide adenylyltransferase n=1 Tax=Tetrapyrgos nigripes TaxID=182062 RepID=A0A8H5FXW5_9AGAR|nr:hypothetical protein D9758_007885 [Tetrapyrgos nigripes]
MAYSQPLSPQSLHPPFRDLNSNPPSAQRLRQLTKQRFVAELSQCLFDFVIQLLPTQEEMAVKEDVRKLLERLIRTIEPDSRLLSFGSTANGFSLRNSDMDLCCLIDSEERLAASDLVTMLGDLLERETKFRVKPLPHARIPIVKLSLDPSPGLPQGIACDIGFENRLALENTRLLMCYAMIDPTRVRTLVLFLKVWSKRRHVFNTSFLHFALTFALQENQLTLQRHIIIIWLCPSSDIFPCPRQKSACASKSSTNASTSPHIQSGHNTWFFDDVELLRQRWHSDNTESVAELLIDFFRYFSRDFPYHVGVASIRAGLLKKEVKGWQNELSGGRFNDARERNRICIEDPFETDFNVARCVTKDGLYTIRGEFMRASRILAVRPERAIIALADLCEERPDEELVTAPLHAPRQVPPQTPYGVGSRPLRSKAPPFAVPPLPAPVARLQESAIPSLVQEVSHTPPPPHMAPKRSKWTSPPPPEAPSADHTLYENQLGIGLELATASTEAREKEEGYNSSSSNSEILDDEERSDIAESDDVRSVRSYTEGASVTSLSAGPPFRRPSWLSQGGPMRLAQAQVDFSNDPPSRFIPGPRFNRFAVDSSAPSSFKGYPKAGTSTKRSPSGPSRSLKGQSPLAISIPLPPSPESSMTEFSEPATVFYQTAHTKSPHSRSTFVYPNGTHSPVSPYHPHHPQHQYYTGTIHAPHDIFPSNLPPMFTSTSSSTSTSQEDNGLSQVVDYPNANGSGRVSGGFNTPTPTTFPPTKSFHSHSHSAATIVPAVPSPDHDASRFSENYVIDSSAHVTKPRSRSRSRSYSRSRSPHLHSALSLPARNPSPPIPISSSTGQTGASATSNSNDSSPTPSSTGYATSISRSPSPRPLSPLPPPIATQPESMKGLDTLGTLGTRRTTPPDIVDVELERVALLQSPSSEVPIEVGIGNVSLGGESGDRR